MLTPSPLHFYFTVPSQEACPSSSIIARKNHFPIFWDNKQQSLLFTECLLNARLWGRSFIYIIFEPHSILCSYVPRADYSTKRMQALQPDRPAFTARVTLSKWLSHSVPVSSCFVFFFKGDKSILLMSLWKRLTRSMYEKAKRGCLSHGKPSMNCWHRCCYNHYCKAGLTSAVLQVSGEAEACGGKCLIRGYEDGGRAGIQPSPASHADTLKH